MKPTAQPQPGSAQQLGLQLPQLQLQAPRVRLQQRQLPARSPQPVRARARTCSSAISRSIFWLSLVDSRCCATLAVGVLTLPICAGGEGVRGGGRRWAVGEG
jgi:hypothetical protein